MKKYNLSSIMKRAWELVKKAGLCISEGLKLAWKEAKLMGRGRIINGICTDEYKSFAQRQALSLVDWGFGAKLYYDCKKEDWFCKNPGGSLIKKILWTVADKLEVL